MGFPYLINIARDDDKKNFDNMVENLCISGKSYIYNNIDNFPELSIINTKIEIKISELIAYGNVNKNILNPKTKNTIKNDKLILTVLADNSLECEYIEY